MPGKFLQNLPRGLETFGKGDKITRSHHHGLACVAGNDLELTGNHEAQLAIGHDLVRNLIANGPFFLVARCPRGPILYVKFF